MCSLFTLWISTFWQNFITFYCLVFELYDLDKKKEKEEEEEKEEKMINNNSPMPCVILGTHEAMCNLQIERAM